MDKEKFLKLWFLNLPIKDELKIKLLTRGLELDKIYEMNRRDWMDLGLNICEADEVLHVKNREKEIYNQVKFLIDNELTLILFNDDEYPAKLKNIYDPPAGLFIKGNILDYTNTLAVVGSRKATNYGLTVAYKFSREISKYGIKIVSGLAKGIDTAAHLGCLDADGVTAGVLGSGFKFIYPISNKEVINRIALKGAVLTEFLPDEKPYPQNFPRRNRIISGLADFVLVVEATDRSGSLITARLALEQGKDVFAVPGNIFSLNSVGTNNLIKDGAKLVSNIEDILLEYGISLKNNMHSGYNELELTIINILKIGAITIEELLERIDVETNDVLRAIGKLECNGIIKRAFGNYITLKE
ncbi:MAG: DNA-processing protein DprA [Caloramator sp.]|nr:DNA-processing protein DprA [Caloramator sp.]